MIDSAILRLTDLVAHYDGQSSVRVVDLDGLESQMVNAATPVIVRDPDILGGTPVFRGTRVPFQTLLDYLEGGQTLDEFLDDFPTVSREAAVHALEHAKSLVVSELG
jgi:uncharacterized protein (DUF433 family)